MLGWLSQLSVQLWLRAWSCGSWVWDPHRACYCQHTACFGSSVSLPSLSTPPLFILSLKNKQTWKKYIIQENFLEGKDKFPDWKGFPSIQSNELKKKKKKKKKSHNRVPGWLSQLSILTFILAQVIFSQFMKLSPVMGFALTEWNLAGILYPSLCPSPAHAYGCMLSPSKREKKGAIARYTFIKFHRIEGLNIRS